MGMHHADSWEAIADTIPDAPALACGEAVITWGEMDVRAARLHAAFAAGGLSAQSKVAIDLYNGNELMETFYGAVKGRYVPVSINYRYLDDELAYLLENSQAEALVFHASLGERAYRVAQRTGGMKVLIQVDDLGGAPLPPGVFDYEAVVRGFDAAPRIARDPDDIVMWYSGGTTGLPKGVKIPIGRSTDHSTSREGRLRTLGWFDRPVDALSLDLAADARMLWESGERPIAVPAAPLMHSTANSYAGPAILHCGGMVVTLENHSFDAHELFRAVQSRKVSTIAIVGDAFAKPMTRALEEQAATGQPYDTASLKTIYSAGVVWSADVKNRLFEHIPQVMLVDNCGSSEGAWFGTAIMRKGDTTSSAAFKLVPGVLVLDEDGNPMPPGSGKPGLLASPTSMEGYYRDPEKTAQNFRHIDGAWYTIPGDLGLVHEDGTLVLIGRGTSVINTGGEKVYPEEVDDTVKLMEDVDDCLVFGTPHERFGQQVTAVVQLRPGARVAEHDVTDWVKARLASYKAPRRVLFVDKVPRMPNGKPDYAGARAMADAATSPGSPTVS